MIIEEIDAEATVLGQLCFYPNSAILVIELQSCFPLRNINQVLVKRQKKSQIISISISRLGHVGEKSREATSSCRHNSVVPSPKQVHGKSPPRFFSHLAQNTRVGKPGLILLTPRQSGSMFGLEILSRPQRQNTKPRWTTMIRNDPKADEFRDSCRYYWETPSPLRRLAIKNFFELCPKRSTFARRQRRPDHFKRSRELRK